MLHILGPENVYSSFQFLIFYLFWFELLWWDAAENSHPVVIDADQDELVAFTIVYTFDVFDITFYKNPLSDVRYGQKISMALSL